MAITQVTSVGLKDGEIVNADLHSSAAIALSKLGTSGTAGSGNFLRGDGAWSAIDLSAKLNTTGGTLTGDLTLSTSLPTIIFNDTDSENDFNIQNINGTFAIGDIDAGAARLEINSSGVATFRKNLNALEGFDVTGNITVTGTVDGVDIAARNTLFGGLTSSSGVLSNGVTATTQSASDNSTKVATTAYTDTAISNLVDSSPSALNTLNELAAALGDDANFSTTVTNSIATKAVLTGSTNNTICTVTGANALQGEAGLTFDGSILKVLNASTPQIRINNDTSDGSSTRLLIGKATASNNFFNGAASGDSCISAPTNLLLGNGSTERLRIDSNGKVLIGTTTPQGNANADDLVISTSGTTGLTIRSGSTSHNGNIFFARGTSGVDEFRGWITYDHSQQHLTFGTNAQEIFRAFSGRFGIGTASPTRTLEVRGPSDSHLAITVPGTTQTSALLFGDSGDDDIGAISYIHSDNSMRFVTNTAERLRIQSDGNIGVGGTAPNYQLHCTAGIGIGGHGLSNQQLSLTNNAIQSLNLGVGYTALLLNKDGGNVGIGTSSPGHKLDVVGGNIRVGKTSNGQFIAENSSGAVKIKLDSSGVSYLIGGQVNVGASSPTASENGQFNCYTTTSSGKAQFVHDAGTGGLRLAGTGSGSGANLVFSNNYNSGTFSDHWTFSHNGGDDSFRVLSGGTGGTERLRIGPTGEIGVAGAGSINFGSAGQVLTSGGSSAGCQWKSGGKIVQVVQHIRNDGWSESVSAGGKSSASLSDTITTTSNNNKVLVHVSATLGASGTINRATCILERNGTEISDAQSQNLGNNRHEVTASAPHENANQMTHISFTFLDSPGNAGSYTYSITHRHGSSSTKTLYMNQAGIESNHHYRFRAASFIVLQEVAA